MMIYILGEEIPTELSSKKAISIISVHPTFANAKRAVDVFNTNGFEKITIYGTNDDHLYIFIDCETRIRYVIKGYEVQDE